MIIEGALGDRDGARRGYARFDGDRVVETGQVGTDSTRGRVRRVRGIVVPRAVNGHTHLGDAVSTREPPHRPLAEIVGGPGAYKFELLARASRRAKRDAMRRTLRHLAAEGTGALLDFREEGREGVELLRAAAQGIGLDVVALGRTCSST